ncbi:MAG: pyridoxamine 5'-phosphate oxidase family protein [Dehalococcoidales bacterium]|nr:pyridoxamine 5'-phosphate oxidase family protein [Dehalococcoidales bacterium]
MNKAEILAFLNANPTCYLATVEGDKPHVRAMGMVKADENGIIIETGTFKDVYKQLSANPNVELCFFNAKQGTQVRVSGAVEQVDDLKLKDEIIAQRPFLKQRVEEGGYEAMGVFRLKGVAYVWTFQTASEPKTYIQL